MDLKTALASAREKLTDQFDVSQEKHYRKPSKKKSKKEIEAAAKVNLNELCEEDKNRVIKARSDFSSASSAQASLLTIDKSFKEECQRLSAISDEDEFNAQAKELITRVEEAINRVPNVRGLKVFLDKVLVECRSLYDGLETYDVTPDDMSLWTLDAAISRVNDLVRIYNKRQVRQSNEDQAIDYLVGMLGDMQSKIRQSKLKRQAVQCDIPAEIITGPAVMPLGTFSAKLLTAQFDASSELGYPVLFNQMFFAVSAVDAAKVNIEQEVANLIYADNNSEIVKEPLAIVSRQPNAYEDKSLYWIMTAKDLEKLRSCAMYQSLMCLKTWSLIC